MKKILMMFLPFLAVLQVMAGNVRPGNSIKFIDYNIMNGMWWDQYNNYDRFVTWMNGQAPDVFAICEGAMHKDRELHRIHDDSTSRYLPYHLKELAQRWGHSYVAVGPCQDNYPVAITSRYPIEVVQKIGGGLSHGALHVKIRGVNYIVIHTWPLGRYQEVNVKGVPENVKKLPERVLTCKGGDKSRYEELKAVINLTINNPKFKDEKYWIMTGDMNSRSAVDDAYYKSRNLTCNYDAMNLMLDAFGNDVMNRFHEGKYMTSLPSGFARLDYFYANDALFNRTFSAETIYDDFTRVASDHFPICMEFEDVLEEENDILKKEICIIPKPVSVERKSGFFKISEQTRLFSADSRLRKPASIFASYMEPVLGFELSFSEIPAAGSIELTLDGSLEKEEYILEVRRSGIVLRGGSPHGVSHGLQTLRQVILEGRVHCMTVKDKPCFAYRGTMLDVARHFFTVEEVKSFIDMIAMHKMNVFHWHLTEDQGWRIEIKKYPELTKVGSVRRETIIGQNRLEGAVFDGTGYGGYYSQEEVKEIVKYAEDRYITVIPEIEMPGHGMGALTSYPWLGCTGGPYSVWTRWGISEDVYCAGKESTFQFIEDVLSEILELFPSQYIHIGGDECPKDRWRQCPLCQKRIEEEGLRDERQLQSYFIHRIEAWLNSHGRKLIGWDEIIDGGISKSATVMTWRDQHNGVKAAMAGNDVIMTPKWNCYFDYAQTGDPLGMEPLCGTRYLPVKQVYSLDPYSNISRRLAPRILGVQANVWTEYIPDIKSVQYKVLPRLAALSEVGWSYDRKNFLDFKKRSVALLPQLYRKCGYTYAPYFFTGQDQ